MREEPWVAVSVPAAELKQWSNEMKAGNPGPSAEDLARLSAALFTVVIEWEAWARKNGRR